jgi:hypothetical protein
MQLAYHHTKSQKANHKNPKKKKTKPEITRTQKIRTKGQIPNHKKTILNNKAQ